jgi:hypothetical protein
MDAAAGATDAVVTVTDAATRDVVSQDVARSAGSTVARFAAEAGSTVAADSMAEAGASTVAAGTAAADTAKSITDQ